MMQFPSEVHAVRLAHRENSLISRIDTGLLYSVHFSENFKYNIAYIMFGRVNRIQDTRILKLNKYQVTSVAQISIFYSAQFFENFLPFCLKERAATEDYGVTFDILVACACGNYAANIAPRDIQFVPFSR